MSKVEELTDSLIAACCPVPAIGPGVCRVCRSATNEPWDVCTSCERTIGQVSRPVETIIPISLYEVQSQLWRVLRSYKDGPADSTQQLFRWQVAALLARFIRHHAVCIAGATGQHWDAVTVVPSGGTRAGEHPLEEAVRRASALGALYTPLLVRSGIAVAPRVADDCKYDVIEDVDGRRVLLVDDTFTSGSSVQSAASALQRAGANVLAALVIGRVIRPEFSEAAQRLWTTARRKKFTFERCCLE